MPRYDFAVRITRPYLEVQRIISRWSLECDKMVVYEHTGSVTEKVHIHLAIENSRVCREQLKNLAKECVTVPLKGQGDWSFKVWNLNQQYLIYCTKGKHDPSFNKGYDEEYLNSCKKMYVEPTINASKIERLYMSVFQDNQFLKECYKEQTEDLEHPPIFIRWVRKLCCEEARKMNGTRMLTQKVTNDALCLFKTYCWDNKIRIENMDDPMFKHVNLF